ncbi:hypothetical protein EYF80_032348 [Liparis tanakae]|uniref:Uncharacterized protein n=1 Tax=Liparis tanakae TaxID=230148 RepID=A0A4Z2GW30_9TELE|nr:hypothetical protein EYF80_032348 [Liparis tanakae]
MYASSTYSISEPLGCCSEWNGSFVRGTRVSVSLAKLSMSPGNRPIQCVQGGILDTYSCKHDEQMEKASVAAV